MQLSLALPCYNEAINAPITIKQCFAWFKQEGIEGEIIAVNDGSTDNTADVLAVLQKEYPQLIVVTHEENQGYGAAVRSGCDAAQYPWIAFMDSDGQFKPEDLKHLIAHCNDYHFVAGIRKKRADPWHRSLNAWLYGALVRYGLSVKIKDLNCGMKLFSKDVWQKVRPTFGLGALFNAEVMARLRMHCIPFYETHVEHYPRLAGVQTGANPLVILRMFKELFQLRSHMNKAKHEVQLLNSAKNNS